MSGEKRFSEEESFPVKTVSFGLLICAHLERTNLHGQSAGGKTWHLPVSLPFCIPSEFV